MIPVSYTHLDVYKRQNIMSDKYVKYPNEDNPLVDSDGNILNPDSSDIIPNAVLPLSLIHI